MAERRQYTGTQRLQLVWSLGVILTIGAVLAIAESTALPISPIVVILILSISWFAGLALLGLRERRQWNEMVEASSFSRQLGPHTADLEKIVDGRSVTVSTTIPGLLSQTHAEFRTSVTGVEASFTVQFERVEEDGSGRDLPITDDKFDELFVIQGSEQNVTRILSPQIQTTLLDIQTPGVCTVTGDYVSYDVPFTNLSTEELDTIAETLVVVAERVEEVGIKSP